MMLSEMLKERKKDTWGNGKMKMRVTSGGIRTHDTLYSRQMLYQLSYQGSPAGRVRIKHLICLYEQANLTLDMYTMYMYMYIVHVGSSVTLVSLAVWNHVITTCYVHVRYITCTCIHVCTLYLDLSIMGTRC